MQEVNRQLPIRRQYSRVVTATLPLLLGLELVHLRWVSSEIPLRFTPIFLPFPLPNQPYYPYENRESEVLQ